MELVAIMSDEKIVLFEAAKHKRHNAAEVDAEASGKRRPELVIDPGDLPATARSLRDLLAASGRLFDRGVPVRIIRSPDGGPPLARPLTANNVVVEAHGMCQPVRVSADGERLSGAKRRERRELLRRESARGCAPHAKACLPRPKTLSSNSGFALSKGVRVSRIFSTVAMARATGGRFSIFSTQARVFG